MPVYSLAYASRANQEFTWDELEELGERAGRKNVSLRITGYLCYQDGSFFQYLEGPLVALNGLMDEIRMDQRHDVFNEIDLGQIGIRNFPDWSMRVLSQDGLKLMRMEDVLRQVLSTMTEVDYGRDRLRKLILPMVTRIADRQTMLSGPPG